MQCIKKHTIVYSEYTTQTAQKTIMHDDILANADIHHNVKTLYLT